MLKKLKETELNSLFSGQILKMVKPFLRRVLPMLFGELLRVQKPVSEGGLRKEEDDGIVVLIAQEEKQIFLNVHPLKWVETEDIQGYLLQKPIRSTDLSELLQGATGINVSELFEEAQVIEEPPINEEE